MLAAAAVTFVVRFLVLTRVIPLVPILSAIPRYLRESTQLFISGDVHYSLENYHQKEILTQRAHSSLRHGTDCPNNRLCYLSKFVQGYYSPQQTFVGLEDVLKTS